MSATSGSGGELRRVVRINEEIKRVVATAFKINLMAMNAIFLAKRAGQAALGFSVLSNELRQFAGDLQKQMGVLREMTHGSVAAITALVKQERRDSVIERLRTQIHEHQRHRVEDCLRFRSGMGLAGNRDTIAARTLRLNQTIADTMQLVEMGSVLARSAKIEAAYGGSFSAALMQVSSDFEKIIGTIQESLEKLTRHQAQETHS